jgi:primosomal protein N' (replication factor Y)
VPLAHLDRPFDYLVPADDDGRAPGVPGAGALRRPTGGRVPAGARRRRPATPGGSRFLDRVVSRGTGARPGRGPAGPASPTGTRDARGRAAAGDPAPARPRRGRAGTATRDAGLAPIRPRVGAAGEGAGAVGELPRGPAFLRALRDGKAPRAVWAALPGEDWPARFAEALAAAHAAGRGAWPSSPTPATSTASTPR